MTGPESCKCGHPRALHTDDHACRHYLGGDKCPCTEWRERVTTASPRSLYNAAWQDRNRQAALAAQPVHRSRNRITYSPTSPVYQRRKRGAA